MDYKTRNPIPMPWSIEDMAMTIHREPYDRMYTGRLRELPSPDRSTTFLIMTNSLDEETGMFVEYAIEAPKNCPARQAFEWGEISWLEFWSHRGWLIKILDPFEEGPCIVQYIKPAELPADVVDILKHRGHDGPFFRKLAHLEYSLATCKPGSKDMIETEKDYRSFMIRYGHRLAKKAA